MSFTKSTLKVVVGTLWICMCMLCKDAAAVRCKFEVAQDQSVHWTSNAAVPVSLPSTHKKIEQCCHSCVAQVTPCKFVRYDAGRCIVSSNYINGTAGVLFQASCTSNTAITIPMNDIQNTEATQAFATTKRPSSLETETGVLRFGTSNTAITIPVNDIQNTETTQAFATTKRPSSLETETGVLRNEDFSNTTLLSASLDQPHISSMHTIDAMITTTTKSFKINATDLQITFDLRLESSSPQVENVSEHHDSLVTTTSPSDLKSLSKSMVTTEKAFTNDANVTDPNLYPKNQQTMSTFTFTDTDSLSKGDTSSEQNAPLPSTIALTTTIRTTTLPVKATKRTASN